MRLLLTLLALLTGLAGAERAVAAPAAPAAMGALVLLADTVGKVESGENERRPAVSLPTRRSSGAHCTRHRKAAPAHLPGLLSRADRALE